MLAASNRRLGADGMAKGKGTTEPGHINPRNQMTLKDTGRPGTDHLQRVYALACLECLTVYGANGSDIHMRKCPECQDGNAGLRVKD
jgi:hypothetical protein